jgi:hypothetical protein
MLIANDDSIAQWKADPIVYNLTFLKQHLLAWKREYKVWNLKHYKTAKNSAIRLEKMAFAQEQQRRFQEYIEK